MQDLALFDDLIAMLITLVMTLAIPPVGSGAFWSIVALYGVVSVLFDDETPRGIPGIEYLQRRHPQQQS
jgi:hypothetical protein